MVACTDNDSVQIGTDLSNEEHPHTIVGEGTVISELPIPIPGVVSTPSQPSHQVLAAFLTSKPVQASRSMEQRRLPYLFSPG